MQDQFAEILYYIKATFRYKWLIIIVAWLVCLPGWWHIMNMQNQYESTARVHVDTRTMLRPLLSGLAIQADVWGMLSIMKQLMFTRHNLEKIAHLAGLGKDANTEEAKLALVNKLKNNIKIGGGSNEIFSISYASGDPNESKHVVQAVLTIFSEQTQQTALDDVDSAQRFLVTQIQEYEQRLRNAEKAKENFKRTNIGMLPGQGADQVGQIQQINTALDEGKVTLEELMSRKKVLQEQLTEVQESGEDKFGLAGLNDSLSQDPRLTALITQRDELLIRYTQKHPSIKVLNDTIKAIKTRMLMEAEKGVEGSDNILPSNPFARAIKASINEVDAQIASLKARISSYEKKIEKLDEEFNERLNIETEMQNLNRDYDTIRGNYNALLARRETAMMSEKVDNEAKSLKFKIADPPNMPLAPTAPNRPRLYTAVLGVGVVAGIALAFLVALIKPTFIAANQIRTVTGLPILGSISMVRNHKQIRKLRWQFMQYVLMCSLLISAYTGIMILKA